MLRTTAIGLASALALSVSLASAAYGGMVGGGGGGGGGIKSSGSAGGAIHAVSPGGGNINMGRAVFWGGRSAHHEMAEHEMGRIRLGGDRDRDHDHFRDRDHFRFFPTFAYGVDTYSDLYAPDYGDCWELHRVLRHGAWRLRRVWVCN
jgi:hypothetical protein